MDEDRLSADYVQPVGEGCHCLREAFDHAYFHSHEIIDRHGRMIVGDSIHSTVGKSAFVVVGSIDEVEIICLVTFTGSAVAENYAGV